MWSSGFVDSPDKEELCKVNGNNIVDDNRTEISADEVIEPKIMKKLKVE